MKYQVSFTKSKTGNSAKEGQPLTITVTGAQFIVYGVYKNGFPVLVGQTNLGDDSDTFLLKRKGIILKGEAVLKVTAYDSSWQRFGWKDSFSIV